MFVGWKEKKGENGRGNLIFFAFLLVVKQLFTIFAAEFNKDKELMKRRHVLICLILLLVAACCVGLWGWRLLRADSGQVTVHIDRFDRVLDEYVSLGSGTALHRMNTEYPQQTKLLIEDVLELGEVDEPDVERELRHYYLDSTVQVLLDEVHHQYADVSDLERDFSRVFEVLKRQNPDFQPPHVYTQISCLGQSIVVSDSLLGISLDKYLGTDFPLYLEFYTPEQRRQMKRSDIVTDAVSAYLMAKKMPR